MRFPKNVNSKVELVNLFESWKLSCSKNKIVGVQFSFSIEDYKVPVYNEKDFFNVVDELIRDLKKTDYKPNMTSMDITYNSQWRHFGADKNGENGVDQIADLITILKKKNFDRRLLVVAWNPNGVTHGPILTHCLLQFYVTEGGLSCKLYQSSGTLENVMRRDSARAVILTYMLCQITGLRPTRFIHSFGDIDFDPNLSWRHEMDMENEFPTIKLRGTCNEIEDFVFDDFSIELGIKFDQEFIPNHHFLGDSENGNHEELQYLHLVRNILDHGTKLIDRTKVGTMSIFGPQMVFSLHDDTLPLLTTKRVFARGIIEELLWFLRGSTSAIELDEKNVHIWDANGSIEYLKSIGLGHREAGDLGPVYGFQWRHFGAKYDTMHSDYSNQGVDQIANLIRSIKEDPNNKNHVVMAWNPKDLPLMALPPCHCLVQFFVEEEGELSCKLYQRSGDMGLGVPFNIASYAIFTHMIAHVTGLKPGKFYHTLGDSHVYLNHIDAMKIQVTRQPRDFPKLKFRRQVDRIEDFHVDDFIIENYHPHPKIHMDMAL